MSELAKDTEAPDCEADSVRFLCKAGSDIGRLSFVVAGVQTLIPCRLSKALWFAQDVIEAAKRSP